MKESRFITLSQYSNKWQGRGEMKIDPTQISYIEQVAKYAGSMAQSHSKIHTIYGGIIEIDEAPEDIEEKINDWYDNRDKASMNSITISKDDIVKNFIFRNLTQQQ